MKNYLALLSLSLLLLSCNRYAYSCKECYKVYKIKNNNEYYEIYAKQGGSHYKIISKKGDVKSGLQIKKGGCYKFILKSHEDWYEAQFGIGLRPSHVRKITLSEKTSTKIDGGKITTLHYASNLDGLYLLK